MKHKLDLHFVIGILENVTALFLILAPSVTFDGIIKSKSTQAFSGIPYVTTPLNYLIYTCVYKYGLPFVWVHNELVWTVNATGAVTETVYRMIFIMYAPKKEKVKILWLFAFVLALFLKVALVSRFATHGKTRRLFYGILTAVFSILMYTAPLSVVGAMQLTV